MDEQSDRISTLPDSIIHNILSLLPIEEAIRTEILSKRWRKLWRSIPILKFRSNNGRSIQKFGFFVFRVLLRHQLSARFQKFCLNFDFASLTIGSPLPSKNTLELDSNLIVWLHYARTRDVEKLSLILNEKERYFPYNEEYVRFLIPQSFYYNSSSLKKLYTRFCDYAPRRQVCWTRLKVLSIGEAALTQDGFRNILAGSPLLEYLELHQCWGINSIEVSSTNSLKKLVIRQFLDKQWSPMSFGGFNTLEISIPSVKTLKLLECWQTKCLLLDASSLVEATLDFQLQDNAYSQQHVDMVTRMLAKIDHVQHLLVGPMFIHALSCSTKAMPSLQHNLKCICLNIAVCFNEWNRPGVACLLNGSTNLEKLIIDLSSYHHEHDGSILHDDGKENNWLSMEKKTFECLSRHLTTVEIICLDPRNNRYNHLLQFVEFLLGRARMLEKIVIAPKQCADLEQHHLYEVARNLLTFHRCSPKAVVLMQELRTHALP